jgi:RecJ-like exonuclease
MENPETNHTCTHCDYKSKWKHNLSRHMVTKHTPQIVSLHTQNVSLPAQNVVPISQNVVLPAHNVSLDTESSRKQCYKCQQTFASVWSTKRHISICTGSVNSLTCDFCNKTFAQRSGKCKHLKICKAKAEADSKALVVVNPTQSAEAPEQPSIAKTSPYWV